MFDEIEKISNDLEDIQNKIKNTQDPEEINTLLTNLLKILGNDFDKS